MVTELAFRASAQSWCQSLAASLWCCRISLPWQHNMACLIIKLELHPSHQSHRWWGHNLNLNWGCQPCPSGLRVFESTGWFMRAGWNKSFKWSLVEKHKMLLVVFLQMSLDTFVIILRIQFLGILEGSDKILRSCSHRYIKISLGLCSWIWHRMNG